MAEAEKEVQKPFFKKLGEQEKAEFLERLKNENVIIQVWVKGDTVVEKFTSFPRVLPSFSMTATTTQQRPEENTLSQERNTVVMSIQKSNLTLFNKSVLMNIYLDNLQYFTNARIKYLDKISYSVEFEEEIFKVEKRKSYRLRSSKECRIFYHINGQRYECSDVSTGGISFLIDENEQDLFIKDSKIKTSLDHKLFHPLE